MVSEHTLAVADWLEIVNRDYLRDFIPAGGSAVKIVVAPRELHRHLRSEIARFSEKGGFQYAHVDAATKRIHMIYPLVTEVARQLDWFSIARSFMMEALRKRHYLIPADDDLSIDKLAAANEEAPGAVRQELRRVWSGGVFQDYELSREFRLGAFGLCRGVSLQEDEQVRRIASDVVSWLRGELISISALRSLNIFRKIGRSNGRHTLQSATLWLQKAGLPGLVVTIDISRYALGKNADPNGNVYTKLASLDMHEVLRQFIDGTDELHGALLLFITEEAFLTSDDRGLRNYDALRLRLTDDVRDRRRPNPLAPMVRLHRSV